MLADLNAQIAISVRMVTIGIAVIGKAPRPDVAELFATAAPPGGKVVLLGCLDAISDEEIEHLVPQDGDDTLYTRLPDNRDAIISKAAVIAHAPSAFARLRAAGATSIVFACTGDFPKIPGDEGVLFPSRVLAALAAGLLPEGRLGILIPLAEQALKLKQKWARPGLDVVAEALHPSAGEAEIRRAAERLAAHKPGLVAMDCMSYGPHAKRIVAPIVGVPTLLGNAATCHVLRSIVE
jgi:protein AroM